MSEVFKTLNAINVNENTEEKNGLTYLSWAWAWAELKKVYPDATYQIRQFEGKPYLYDENLGYMVMTEMTVDGITHEMWLPVMDNVNNAMKDKPYEVQTKYKKITIQPATMFDVNKAIMRCLVKNIAMFGLGLYIYAGEDLPEGEEPKSEEQKKEAEEQKKAEEIAKQKIDDAKVKALLSRCKAEGVPVENILIPYKVEKLEDLSEYKFADIHRNWEKVKAWKPTGQEK